MTERGTQQIVAYIAEHFFVHEDLISKQPYHVDSWMAYLAAVEEDSNANLTKCHLLIAKRAIRRLPRSFKLGIHLWELASKLLDASIISMDEVMAVWEHLRFTMHRYPRFWMHYIEFLIKHPGCASVTFVRRTINRILQALPITQHDKVWPEILELLSSGEWQIPTETKLRLWKRYVEFEPSQLSQYAEMLLKHQHFGQAAVVYRDLLQLNMDSEEYWDAFSSLVTQHSEEVEQYIDNWQDILMQNEKKNGIAIAQLADAWIRRGSFDVARSILEQGLMEKVTTARDFQIVYNVYLQLEEGLLEAAANGEIVDECTEQADAPRDENDWDILLEQTESSQVADLELALARAEHLTKRRPLLLNAVYLRQNCNNVGEWVQRAELYLQQNQIRQAAATLEEGLRQVDAKQAVNGQPSDMVVKLTDIYREMDVDQARELLRRICREHEYPFKKADDLANCWARWVELELGEEQWDDALALARQSVAPGGGSRKINLTRNLKLWDLLLDLEESLGTIESTKDAYNRVIDSKAATVQHILNYGEFLTEHKYFEESFTAYERGVDVFGFPHPGAKVLWKAYLQAFHKRYGGTKVERSRDLFQRCLECCPAEECAEFFIMNGSFEEEHGLMKRALSVYHQMCLKVPDDEQLTAYRLYIAKISKLLGITSTRSVYQEAVEKLREQDAALLCLDFAETEASLKQVDRARGVYSYGAQMADPRRLPEFWRQWNDFEVTYGSEDTFREMLRIKRSVEAAFSTVNHNHRGNDEQRKTLSNDEAIRMIAAQEGVELAEKKSVISTIVPNKRSATAAGLEEVEDRVVKLRKAAEAAVNNEAIDENADDDEIDIDDIDAEINAAVNEIV